STIRCRIDAFFRLTDRDLFLPFIKCGLAAVAPGIRPRSIVCFTPVSERHCVIGCRKGLGIAGYRATIVVTVETSIVYLVSPQQILLRSFFLFTCFPQPT